MISSRTTTLGASRRLGQASWSVASAMGLLLLSACSSAPRELQVTTAPVELPRPEATPPLPNPEPINTASVNWIIVTPDRLPAGDGWVLIALTPQDYETLARNQADTLRWVREAMWRLQYYRQEETE